MSNLDENLKACERDGFGVNYGKWKIENLVTIPPKPKKVYPKDFAQSMADLTSLREVLEDTPTVDAKPVVHGRWNYDGSCGICGVHVLSNYMNYCPNCGADMREGSEGE